MSSSKLTTLVLVLCGFCLAGPAWGGILTDTDLPVCQTLASFEDILGETANNPVYVDGEDGTSMCSIVVDGPQVSSVAAVSAELITNDDTAVWNGCHQSDELVFGPPLELLKIPICD